MGVTRKPLRILLTEPEMEPYFEKWKEKGHIITVMPPMEVDVVMGTMAHRLSAIALTELGDKAIELAIKGAQDHIYQRSPNESRKSSKKKRDEATASGTEAGTKGSGAVGESEASAGRRL